MSIDKFAIAAAMSGCAMLAHAATTYSVQTLPAPFVNGASLSPKTAILAGGARLEGNSHLQAALWSGKVVQVLPSSDTGDTFIRAVNDQGVSVGSVHGSDLVSSVAVAWSADHQRHDLPALVAGDYTQATGGISAQGDIAGLEFSGGNRWMPVQWHAGAVQALPMPAGQEGAQPMAVSPQGLIAGRSYAAGFLERAVLWAHGTATLVGPTGSIGLGVNDKGQVVGEAANAPFVATATTTQNLPVLPGDSMGSAQAINTAGVIVGDSACGCGTPGRAVIWHGGAATDLNTLMTPKAKAAGWKLYGAFAIDDKGRILASAQQGTGNWVTVVLMPVKR